MKKILLTLMAAAFALTASAQRQDPAAVARDISGRILGYLESCTPYSIVDGTGQPVQNMRRMTGGETFAHGDFWIMSYEWGVTYSGMLKLAEVLKDARYADYVYERFNAIGTVSPFISSLGPKAQGNVPLRALYAPRFLDDCGAMCAAMSKATLADPARSEAFRSQLEYWYDFVERREYRLPDGILARNRPTTNSVWLDDMYMGIPPIAYRGALADAEGARGMAAACYEEAIRQILLFKKYLWIPEKNLFRHGWIEGMSVHPDYHWARANGWAMLTLCDVLDIVPPETPGWDEALELLRSLIAGIAPLQAPDGRWHQLLNSQETYLETSASAMFVYSIAHAVRKGWIDRTAYVDVALSGWLGVASQVNDRGQVENTCVGTGLGWTNTFYASRPVSVFAAHGYGPVLLAASEILSL